MVTVATAWYMIWMRLCNINLSKLQFVSIWQYPETQLKLSNEKGQGKGTHLSLAPRSGFSVAMLIGAWDWICQRKSTRGKGWGGARNDRAWSDEVSWLGRKMDITLCRRQPAKNLAVDSQGIGEELTFV